MRSTPPTHELAGATLAQQLEAVWQLAKPACSTADDPDSVRKLRVATRRALVSCQAFRELLPERRLKRIRKALKRLRRAAGATRDLDVLLEFIEKRAAKTDDARLADLCAAIAARREEAQQALTQEYERLVRKEFSRRSDRLIDSIEWRGNGDEPDLASMARAHLAPAAASFVTQARADFTSIDQLHELRLRGKRLRYAVELFGASLHEAAAQKLDRRLRKTQRRLGRLNDHATSSALLRSWTETDDAETLDLLEALAVREEKRTGKAQRDFLSWWSSGRVDKVEALCDTLLNAVDGASATRERSGGDESRDEGAVDPPREHDRTAG